MNRTTIRAVAAAAVMALLVTGCGDDDDEGATEDPGTTPSLPSDVEEEAETADGDESAEAVEVTAVDYAFQGLPETAAPGTVLTIVNESEKELHELVAFRLADDETRSVEDLLALPEGEFDPGRPATVLLAPPGGEQIDAVGDGTLADPGRYAIICFIPTGADPAAYLEAAQETQEGPPQVAGGPPHFTAGMYSELLVE